MLQSSRFAVHTSDRGIGACNIPTCGSLHIAASQAAQSGDSERVTYDVCGKIRHVGSKCMRTLSGTGVGQWLLRAGTGSPLTSARWVVPTRRIGLHGKAELHVLHHCRLSYHLLSVALLRCPLPSPSFNPSYFESSSFHLSWCASPLNLSHLTTSCS